LGRPGSVMALHAAAVFRPADVSSMRCSS
jgi:hypothetical protein